MSTDATAFCIFSTMAGGVPAGANRPNQDSGSISGKPASRSVGISGCGRSQPRLSLLRPSFASFISPGRSDRTYPIATLAVFSLSPEMKSLYGDQMKSGRDSRAIATRAMTRFTPSREL